MTITIANFRTKAEERAAAAERHKAEVARHSTTMPRAKLRLSNDHLFAEHR